MKKSLPVRKSEDPTNEQTEPVNYVKVAINILMYVRKFLLM